MPLSLIATLVLIQAAAPQLPPPPTTEELNEWAREAERRSVFEWRALVAGPAREMRARRPDLVRFWDRPGAAAPSRADDAQGRARDERGDYVRAMAAWDEGRQRDTLAILREGIVRDGTGVGPLTDAYVTLLGHMGRWGEARDVIGANLDGEEGFASTSALFGVALAETGYAAPGLAAHARAYIVHYLGLTPAEMERFYPAKGGPATLRRLVWTVYSMRMMMSAGAERWGVWANEDALRVDPTSPILAIFRSQDLDAGRDGIFPITDRAKTEAVRLLTAAIRRLEPTTRLYEMVYINLRRVSREAARGVAKPVKASVTAKAGGG